MKISVKINLTLFCLLFLFIAHGEAQTTSIFINDSLQARKDVIDVIVNAFKWDKKQKPDHGNKKVFFSLMPLSTGTSENGIAVSSVNAAFYMGDPLTTNLSNISFYPSTNFASYFQFKVFPNLWLNNNTWNIPGKIEFSYISHDTYGLGANTLKDSLTVVNYNLLRLYMSLNREIYKHYFLGIGIAFDDFYNIAEQTVKSYPSEFGKYSYGTSDRALSFGPAFTALFDNRKNSINPIQGLFSTVVFRFNNNFFGSDYNWQSIYFDTRKYINLSSQRHKTLALRGLYWGTWGEVPYLNLPSVGYDYSGWTGRGYHRGRYRSTQMLYAETEYRFDVTKNGLWGGVVFMNALSYTEPETEKFKYIKPAAGLGARLKFNKYSDSNITLDFGFGKESFNWYVSLNEVF